MLEPCRQQLGCRYTLVEMNERFINQKTYNMKKHIFITLAVASGVLLSVTAFPQNVTIVYRGWEV